MTQLSRRARAVGALFLAFAIALTVSTVSAAPRGYGVVSESASNRTLTGSASNRTLAGGVARDLSVHELEAINRARGLRPE